MINFDCVAKENIKQHNPDRTKIPDHPYRKLIIGGSGSRKTNSLFNLISHQQRYRKKLFLPSIHIKQSTNFKLTNTKVQA